MNMWSVPLELGNRRNHHVNVHFFSPDGKARETQLLAPILYSRDVDIEHWHGYVNTPGRLKANVGFQIDGQVVQMPDESLLAAAYGDFAEDHVEASVVTNNKVSRTILLKSTDLGRSWKYYSTVASWFDLPEGRRGHGPQECGLARLADGRILAIFRTQSRKNLFQCWSDDDGRTWTKPVDSVAHDKRGYHIVLATQRVVIGGLVIRDSGA